MGVDNVYREFAQTQFGYSALNKQTRFVTGKQAQLAFGLLKSGTSYYESPKVTRYNLVDASYLACALTVWVRPKIKSMRMPTWFTPYPNGSGSYYINNISDPLNALRFLQKNCFSANLPNKNLGALVNLLRKGRLFCSIFSSMDLPRREVIFRNYPEYRKGFFDPLDDDQ